MPWRPLYNFCSLVKIFNKIHRIYNLNSYNKIAFYPNRFITKIIEFVPPSRVEIPYIFNNGRFGYVKISIKSQELYLYTTQLLMNQTFCEIMRQHYYTQYSYGQIFSARFFSLFYPTWSYFRYMDYYIFLQSTPLLKLEINFTVCNILALET